MVKGTTKMKTYSVIRLLESPEIVKIIDDMNLPGWAYAQDSYTNFQVTSLMLSPRCGVDNLFFKQDNNKFDFYKTPKYDDNFNKTYSDITDQRAIDVLNNLPDNKKLWINWSGGIDSTVPLCAILKNWSASDLERVVVGLTPTSIFENPQLYYTFIKDKIKIKNSNDPINMNEYQLILGDPELFPISKYTDIPNVHPGLFDSSIASCKDKFINYLSDRINKNYGVTHYEKLTESAESVGTDYPIETLADLIWWEGFNWQWKGRYGRDFLAFYNPENNFDQFVENNILWYSSTDYQKWSMKNKGPGETYGKDMTKIKMSQKKYIYDFDKNHFYFNFKSKFPSDGRFGWSAFKRVCMVTDDNRCLTVEENFDEIVDSLPLILNNLR